jgi:hypothetical protein
VLWSLGLLVEVLCLFVPESGFKFIAKHLAGSFKVGGFFHAPLGAGVEVIVKLLNLVLDAVDVLEVFFVCHFSSFHRSHYMLCKTCERKNITHVQDSNLKLFVVFLVYFTLLFL